MVVLPAEGYLDHPMEFGQIKACRHVDSASDRRTEASVPFPVSGPLLDVLNPRRGGPTRSLPGARCVLLSGPESEDA